MMDVVDPDAAELPKRRRAFMNQSETAAAATSSTAAASATDPDPVEYPNTVKRRRTSTVTSDPLRALPSQSTPAAEASAATAAASKSNGNESVAGDVDTCRICRGEGTPGEPLFYPCKCSGSIKYVHQDCLMEWLSHSQKKHCELCKTPFRFTKLYSPDMPKHLPLLVFVRHMAKYFLRSLGGWLRAALVTSVWLGLLPYLMRSVWTFLFWLSDEGFGTSASWEERNNTTATQLSIMAESMAVQGFAATTCPSSPLFPVTTTAASRRGIAEGIPSLLLALGDPLRNVSSRHSLVGSLISFLFPTTEPVVHKSVEFPLNATHTARVVASVGPPPYGSLLSEVSFLKNLTSHAVINQSIIAILEGQIITVLVIVCFILIILVRDYVVQQQPEINMRAAFAAQQVAAGPPQDVQPPPDLEPEPEPEPEAELEPEHDHVGRDDVPFYEELQPNLAFNEAADDDDSITAHYDELDDYPGGREQRYYVPGQYVEQRQSDGASISESRPTENDLNERNSTVNQYLRIFREASGDPDRILQIIHDEGLEERLAYWVRATETMSKNSRKENEGGTRSSSPSDRRRFPTVPEDTERPRESVAEAGFASTSPSQASEHGPETGVNKEDWKGKGIAINLDRDMLKQTLDSPEETSKEEFLGEKNDEKDDQTSSFSSRPRAVSDGPRHHDTINPLANNSWSFSNLPTSTLKIESEVWTNGDSTAAGTSAFRASDYRHGREAADKQEEANRSMGGASDDEADAEADGGSWIDVDDVDDADVDVADDGELDENMTNGEMEAVAGPPRQPTGLVDRMADFMWGDVEDGELGEGPGPGPVELFIDNRIMPFPDANQDDSDTDSDDEDREAGEMAQDVVEAAVAAGIDPEALEDAEDFEGIMELIGMRGPIMGLFQNALFCCFLVSITIFLGIFLPYNIGRLAVWVVANPTRLVQMVFSFSKFIQDIVLLAVGWTLQFALDFLHMLRAIFKIDQGRELLVSWSSDARLVTTNSLNRIVASFMSEIPLLSASEIRNFSALSHEALIHVKSQFGLIFTAMASAVDFIFGGDYSSKFIAAKEATAAAAPGSWESVWNMTLNAVQPNPWMISLNLPERSSAVDPMLAYWNAKDRTLAILGGYISFSVMAALYLGRGTPFSSSQTAQEWEASIIDALNQASGVMKVILIISIEMLIFPLYCGMLLDFALLPLFESTSLRSRVIFTYNYPLTSIFVHWFVGTGYMFHFALFVSMCRKIMRKGVLYFIRDPDDPEFHPVRDVLERNVTTQLRKILFSAFVYGALVIVCLGGVVWGLSLALPNVLPIHYSSNEPVLEFPIDLLFYNFLMPLAVKFFRPSDGLHGMYTWWFRRCARTLRLTWFLFGERKIDEEGILQLALNSPYQNAPWYRTLFLELDKNNKVTPKTWGDLFDGADAKPLPMMQPDDMKVLIDAKDRLVGEGHLITDGRFVRTPASDQVKIPKGQPVFQNVTEKEMQADTVRHSDSLPIMDRNYQYVYIPPWFRVRVFLFILFIWIFAAVTGVSFTIVPLVFGREMFRVMIPAHIRTNDIYAFSIGIYILGSLSYFIFHARRILGKLRDWVSSTVGNFLGRDVVGKTWAASKMTLRLGYTYTMLLVVLPLLVTLLVELYVLMPVHTWMYPSDNAMRFSTTRLAANPGHGQGHTIRLVQAWTLGLLYLKLGSRILVLYGGRPSQAVRAVLRRGWLDPDAGVLTRAFVLPGVLMATVLVFVPPAAAAMVIRRATGTMAGIDEREMKIMAFRMSYPLAALALTSAYMSRRMVGVMEGWRARVRDEAYLMGERLHNFGGLVAAGAGKNGGARGEWRQGARL